MSKPIKDRAINIYKDNFKEETEINIKLFRNWDKLMTYRLFYQSVIFLKDSLNFTFLTGHDKE